MFEERSANSATVSSADKTTFLEEEVLCGVLELGKAHR